MKGLSLPADGGFIKVELFYEGWRFIIAKLVKYNGGEEYVEVVFPRLSPDDYIIQVWNIPKDYRLSAEFWGNYRMQVISLRSDTMITYYKHTPYITRVEPLWGSEVVEGSLSPRAVVKNQEEYPVKAFVNLKIYDSRGTLVYNRTSATGELPPMGEAVYELPPVNLKPGNYTFIYAVYSYYGRFFLTDQNIASIRVKFK